MTKQLIIPPARVGTDISITYHSQALNSELASALYREYELDTERTQQPRQPLSSNGPFIMKNGLSFRIKESEEGSISIEFWSIPRDASERAACLRSINDLLKNTNHLSEADLKTVSTTIEEIIKTPHQGKETGI